jgi:predicted molibdopterin-dependent oxidoreductase YjgC
LIKFTINNRPVEADDGTTVAAAVYQSGTDVFRRSVTGEARGPLCGMGICFECRVTIDGVMHERSCNILVREGMEVVTDA